VAHNFNNVLMAVMGNLQAAVPLLSSAEPETGKAIELVGNALKSAVAGRELGARLGAYVGGVKGDQRRLEPIELAPAVQAALDLARTGWSHLGLNKVEFRTSLTEDVFVRARRGELMEVFLNLIKNAMEAMPKGGVLSLSQEEKDGEVWLSFSDTGHGMDSQTRARAFDPFFSTKGATVRGLGLSSSRGILRSFQGELEVRESGEPGATLVVKLKRETPAESIVPSPPATRFATGGQVLLVEDEALVALGLEAMLVQAGYSVRKAGSLLEAREALSQDKPDVVLCDMVLPDGLGSDLAKEMEVDGAGHLSIPFVILTGWSPELTQQTPEWEGFAEAVLHKPVERGSLLNAIAQVLADCKTTKA
jgi:CheY-like chemotaxis protein